MLDRVIKTTAVLGAIWSFALAGFVWLVGAAFSMTDRFNGPKAGILSSIWLMELCLLAALYHAYRLRTMSALVIAVWLAVGALLIAGEKGPTPWLSALVGLCGYLAPVAITAILLALRAILNRRPRS